MIIIDQQFLHTVFGQLACQTRGDLLAGLNDHFLGLCIDQIRVRLLTAQTFSIKRCLPSAILGLGKVTRS